MDIFANVSKRIPSRLLFVGEGPDLSKMIAKVKELGLTDKVTFCGKQDDVSQVISLADVMLLPSEKERASDWSLWKLWPVVCQPSVQMQEGFPS